MMKKNLISLTVILALLTACQPLPKDAYENRGGPESLLDMSSEAVTLPLDNMQNVDELISWINEEQPSRATLSCIDANPLCSKARLVLEQFAVPYQYSGNTLGHVALYYERVMARDCENSYVENNSNLYNLHHPSFGCSIAANMVQQVTDKRQFINPNLLEYMDGEQAVTAVGRYRAGPSAEDSASKAPIFNSLGSGQ